MRQMSTSDGTEVSITGVRLGGAGCCLLGGGRVGGGGAALRLFASALPTSLSTILATGRPVTSPPALQGPRAHGKPPHPAASQPSSHAAHVVGRTRPWGIGRGAPRAPRRCCCSPGGATAAADTAGATAAGVAGLVCGAAPSASAWNACNALRDCRVPALPLPLAMCLPCRCCRRPSSRRRAKRSSRW